MKNTKKAIALLLAFVLTVSLSVATTVAYLTSTASAQNTFTVGDVKISLLESAVKVGKNNNGFYSYVDNDGETRTSTGNKYENLVPGSTVCKDPEIKNIGTVDAYLAAKVTVNVGKDESGKGIDVEEILGCSHLDMLDVTKILSGGLAVPGEDFVTSHPLHNKNGLPVYGDEDYSVYQVPNKAEGTYTFYFFIEKVKAPNESIVLFEKIDIPATWTNEQLALIGNLKIDIEAYGVQESGFKNCYEAVTTAFPTVFAF